MADQLIPSQPEGGAVANIVTAVNTQWDSTDSRVPLVSELMHATTLLEEDTNLGVFK